MNHLKSKADDNYKIAKISEKSKCFDVAVSRYYYYLYQNIILYNKINDVEIQEVPISLHERNSLHERTLNGFLDYIIQNIKMDFEHFQILGKLLKLRLCRNKSDYSNNDRISEKSDFNRIFKRHFTEVEDTLRIIKII